MKLTHLFMGVVLLWLVPSLAHAATLRLIVWHPGEAGTTAQAQPLMDLWGDYLATHIPGTTWEIRYFPDVGGGRAWVNNQRPAFGIVNDVARAQVPPHMAVRNLLATRPLPHGRTTEHRHWVRGPCADTKAAAVVHATAPLPAAGIQRDFALAKAPQVHITPNLLGTLKQIAGGVCASAVVSEREWRTIARLTTPWRQALRATPSTRAHPTPRVVQFGATGAAHADGLQRALRGMNSDAEGRTILGELQLKGFE